MSIMKSKSSDQSNDIHPDKKRAFEEMEREPVKPIRIDVPESLFWKLEKYLVTMKTTRTKWFIDILDNLPE